MDDIQNAANEAEVTSNVTVEVPADVAVVASSKKKASKKNQTGNLIMDVASEVESLSKEKALSEAERLATDIEVNYFRLGGVLALINQNSWFEGFPTFDDMVFEKFGFQARKARYLITIYENLVTKQIPWEKVAHIGWTKLKDLAPILTPENVDDWVAKAEKCTVAELQLLIKGGKNEGSETTDKTTDEIIKMTFKFKADQHDVVSQAIAKAKGELHTEFDTVAVENICAGYVGGVTAVAKPSMDELILSMGFMPVLTRVSELFPEYDIKVAKVDDPAEPVAE